MFRFQQFVTLIGRPRGVLGHPVDEGPEEDDVAGEKRPAPIDARVQSSSPMLAKFSTKAGKYVAER